MQRQGFLFKWRSSKAWQIVLIVLAAASAVTLAYGSFVKEAQGWPRLPPIALLVIGALLALMTFFDKVAGLWDGAGEVDVVRARLRVTEALNALLATLSLETDLPVDALGASLFAPPAGSYDPASRLARVSRIRLVLGVSPSRIDWESGKGAVGACWKQQVEVHRDLGAAVGAWKPDLSEAAFARLPSKVRGQFTHSEFVSIAGKYREVLAVPIKSGGGNMLGVISVDVTAATPKTRESHLNTGAVRKFVVDAAAMVRDDLSKLDELG